MTTRLAAAVIALGLGSVLGVQYGASMSTAATTTTTIETTTTTTEAEGGRGVPTLSAEPIAPTTARVPRQTMPLAEAKEKGLWGRPLFEGCVSNHGVPSPDWLGKAMLDAGWPKQAWTKLCRVIGCESGFRPEARGGLGNRMVGLLQIDEKSWRSKWPQLGLDNMFDPVQNLRFGLWLYQTTRDNDDWNQWPADQWTCNRA